MTKTQARLAVTLVCALTGAALFGSRAPRAADHNDPPMRTDPSVAATGDKAADIADLYAWVTGAPGDANRKLVLVLTFGGPIGEGWGSLFVVLDDGRLPGLGYLQRYRFIRDHPDLRRFTELRDLDGPRQVEIKEAFDPVARNPLWRVVLRS